MFQLVISLDYDYHKSILRVQAKVATISKSKRGTYPSIRVHYSETRPTNK